MLKKAQLEHIEKRLLEERARALRSLGLFDQMAKADRESADSDLAAYTDHMADQGTEAMEREKAAELYREMTGFGSAAAKETVPSASALPVI